jgi:hypothetical protein
MIDHRDEPGERGRYGQPADSGAGNGQYGPPPYGSPVQQQGRYGQPADSGAGNGQYGPPPYGSAPLGTEATPHGYHGYSTQSDRASSGLAPGPEVKRKWKTRYYGLVLLVLGFPTLMELGSGSVMAFFTGLLFVCFMLLPLMLRLVQQDLSRVRWDAISRFLERF